MMRDDEAAVDKKPVDLTRYDDVSTVWRCPFTSVQIGTHGDEHYHRGTLTRIDGEVHARKRKALGSLLARRGHAAYREKWLFPVVKEAVAALVESGGPTGSRIEVVSWGRRITQQLAAAIAGYDGGTTAEGADRLFELSQVMLAGRPSLFRLLAGDFDENDPVFKKSLEAKAQIVEEFQAPALRRRLELVQQVADGSLAAESLPIDFLMLAAQKTDPSWEDPSQVVRDALLLMGAAVHTTTNSLVWALQEIFLWLGADPSRARELESDAFILRLAQESLRLHPVVPGFNRLATEDIALPSGGVLGKGEIAILRSGPASADSSVFGSDALEFRPERSLAASVSRFGLAFGQGAHMCFGMPLVMGTGGIDGSLVYLLKLLLNAGVRPDGERNVPFDVTGARGQHAFGRDRYYVTIGGQPAG